MVNRKKKTPGRNAKSTNGTDCVVPPALPAEALESFLVNPESEGSASVRSYVEWQAPDETVVHLEKIATEHIFGQPMAGWDVRTDKNRWWVVTNPTNLYSQELFPSLDYTFSFHVGLSTRMMQSEMCREQEAAHDRINQLWNRLAGAQDTLSRAEKVEEFQSVGMKCRECLLLMVKSLAQPDMVIAGEEPPKAGDVVHWCERIADHIAAGSSNENIRGYLKHCSKQTWQLVNWLTHSQNAGKYDAVIAVQATENVLETFMTAWARFEAPKQAAKRRTRGDKK